jgi:hypothetical protein
MTNVPQLLDEAGEASIATAVMMSHHGFRRAIRRFGAALEALAGGGTGRPPGLARRVAELSGHPARSGHGRLPRPRTRARGAAPRRIEG